MYNYPGMCSVISHMYIVYEITHEEKTTLLTLLEQHRPKKTLYNEDGSRAACWYTAFYAEPRLKFLESLIIKYTI